MIVNIVEIMWLLFMTIAVVTIGLMALTEMRMDYKRLCDEKEVKRLKKTIEEQREEIKGKQRLIFELQRENEILWNEKRHLDTTLHLLVGDSEEENESASSGLDYLIGVDVIQKIGEQSDNG